jgi:tetratricopeptide (TPR) repeat protein
MSAHRSRLNSLTLGALSVALIASSVRAQSAAAHRLLDSALVLLAKATPLGDLSGIKSAEALLERATMVQPNDAMLLHWQAFATYREVTLMLGRQQGEVAPLLDRADSLLERASLAGKIPENHALRSSVYGMMISSSPIKGMTLGPKSGMEMEKAIDMAPNNPRVWLVRGIGAINTPAMFGGGLDRAEEFLKKSIDLFATDKPVAPAPSWGLNEAYRWLGQVYEKQQQTDSARASYTKALELEPNDKWVRYSLLPGLNKK